MKKNKTTFEDDGRTIVPMDFDRYLNEVPKKKTYQENMRPGDDLSRGQMKEVLKGSIKASLLVAGVMSLVLVLFVLFSLLVWFR
jgi:multidrug efflux pump subunit AcrB